MRLEKDKNMPNKYSDLKRLPNYLKHTLFDALYNPLAMNLASFL